MLPIYVLHVAGCTRGLAVRGVKDKKVLQQRRRPSHRQKPEQISIFVIGARNDDGKSNYGNSHDEATNTSTAISTRSSPSAIGH